MSTGLQSVLSEGTVREISEGRDEPEWLLQQRLDALEALDDLAFPAVIKTPGRKWTDLADLDFESFVDPLTQSDEKDQVGPSGVEVLPFAEAVDAHPELVESAFGNVVDPQTNYLTALSTALFTSGTVIYVPEGVNAEDVKVRTTMNSRSLFNYTLVVAEESSSVTILERQQTGDEVDGARYYSGITEIATGENAYVQYGSMQDLDQETYNYQLKRGVTDTYGTCNIVDANVGSRLTKTSVEVELEGDSSETKIVGAFYGHDDQHFDIDSRVWHEGEHTTADLVTRGVIDDDSRSVYEGVQNVGREAWDTSSYQRENTLMLSDESEADASPKLIINNHDTEASHSATVGQVDQQELFYMKSRGVPEQLAKNMLVEGFYVPVLDEIEVEELREDLLEVIRARLASRTA
ncbi:Fe-S cluster assembly protein SufD [Salinirubellus salinus]|uniref:Fe-S cluster assembly protein SufD n=1 Tax=Salinirubellus salinus TaxID=1364945 RepID=A0A9E7R622_9EURY|nr:Fe-S cluster assembly protein SufD [Salinirubellus salinus]UWM55373.1 Fe-S cluster assembly protein SufD [Salinirubellus salinus]